MEEPVARLRTLRFFAFLSLIAALAALSYLFVSERKPHRNISEAAIEKVIRKINGRSAFNISKPVTPHVLRHTTATIALQSGMPIEEISKLLGHENISTTMIYAHASLESVRSGHQKHIV